MFVQTNNSRFIQLFRACCRTFCLTLLAVVQIAFVSGCAVTPKYPPQLAAFASGEEKLTSCPRIVGCYADKGEALTVEGQSAGEVSLSQLLCGDYPACAAADTVTVLEPEPDVIEIQFSKQGQSFTALRFSKYTWVKAWNCDSRVLGRPYYCSKGFMIIERGSEQHMDPILASGYVVGKDCILRKAVDGSLIVLQKESSMGIFLLFPVPLPSSHTWCRFPPIGDDF